MKSTFLWLIVACLLVNLNGYGQPPSGNFKTFIASLDSPARRIPVEKVHVHFDKPWYSVGDTIWMKAYVVNDRNVPSSLSQIVYIDLISEQDSIRVSLRLPLAEGLGAGAFTLDSKVIPQGNYHIRAYTNWMRNFGEDAYFDKKIKIGDALTTTSAEAAAAPQKKSNVVAAPNYNVAVQFFPEGGELVNGLAAKVGFKAVGPDGLSRQVAGYIADKDNKQVATFKSENGGMGAFMLQPAAGNTYTAVIKLPDNTEKRVALPAAKDEGYTLAISQDKNNVVARIAASRGLLKGRLILIAKAKNEIVYSAEKDSSNIAENIKTPANTFPEGIVQFTLYSPENQPVAERLAFIHHPEKDLKIAVKPDKQPYNSHDKAHFDLQVTGQDGKLVSGSFSMAVVNEDKVPYKEADEKTIFSNLLLTSELKGYIEQPNYYFSDTSATVTQQLDNLVLIQGWRKFTGKSHLPGILTNLPYQPEMGDADISGRALTSRGKPIPYAPISLLVLQGEGQFINTTANETGFFNISNVPFSRGTSFYAQVDNNKNAQIELDGRDMHPVTVKNLPDEEAIANNNFEVYLDNTRKQFDEEKKKGLIKGTLLKEVDINEKKVPPTIKELAVRNSANLNGPGKADQVITFMDLLGCPGTLAECLQLIIPGLKIAGGVPTDPLRNAPLTLIIDGVERTQAFNTLTKSMISSVEVLRHSGTSVYGLSGAQGVLVITTKQGDLDYAGYAMEYYRPGSTNIHQSNLFTYMGGYDPPRKFYVPDYDNPKVDREIADLRPVIYWNSNIATHADKKASVDFFNGAPGNYKLIIEGLDFKGNLGRTVYRYTVK